MSADDSDFDDEEQEDNKPSPAGDGATNESGEAQGSAWQHFREWLTAKRGWILIVGLSIAQALFAYIVLTLRSEAKPVMGSRQASIRDLAVDMLGHEIKISQIDQLIPMHGGKSMMLGMDLVLVLGQLPAEQVEGSPRPSEAEFAVFTEAIMLMEPAIRSRINILLHQLPTEDLESGEAQKALKQDVQNYVNDTLERLDFGKKLRKGIGKRRVTDVLLPSFIREIG